MQLLIGLFSFRGTLGRGEYWAWTSVAWLLFSFAHTAMTTWVPPSYEMLVTVPLSLAMIVALISLSARRLHDRALSATCLLAVLIPVIGALWLFGQLALCGTGRYPRMATRSSMAWRPRTFQ